MPTRQEQIDRLMMALMDKNKDPALARLIGTGALGNVLDWMRGEDKGSHDANADTTAALLSFASMITICALQKVSPGKEVEFIEMALMFFRKDLMPMATHFRNARFDLLRQRGFPEELLQKLGAKA